MLASFCCGLNHFLYRWWFWWLHWVGRLCSDGFSVVLSWLCGFFCGGFFRGGFFCGGFAVFSDMLWWLGGFSDVLSWLGGFFCGAAVFFCASDGA
jgi:hypothetical protein